MNGLKKFVVVGACLVVVFLIGLVFHRKLVAQERAKEGSPLTSFRVTKNTIVARDQASGPDVVIETAMLLEPAYVVLHDDEEGPGRVLGYSRLLMPGAVSDLHIDTGEKLPSGWYYAVLHGDDRDGIYEIDQDEPLRDVRGREIMARFLISGEIPRPTE